jgi:hypothetical protein
MTPTIRLQRLHQLKVGVSQCLASLSPRRHFERPVYREVRKCLAFDLKLNIVAKMGGPAPLIQLSALKLEQNHRRAFDHGEEVWRDGSKMSWRCGRERATMLSLR